MPSVGASQVSSARLPISAISTRSSPESDLLQNCQSDNKDNQPPPIGEQFPNRPKQHFLQANPVQLHLPPVPVCASASSLLYPAAHVSATGIEHQHRARSGASDCRAVRSAAGARHEDLVERADLESAVAVLRADTDRVLRSQGAGIVAVVAVLRFLPV